MGQSSTVRYTEAQWSDPEFRRKALQDAREQAMGIRGKVTIKVTLARGLTKVAEIAYIPERNGYTVKSRHLPGAEYV